MCTSRYRHCPCVREPHAMNLRHIIRILTQEMICSADFRTGKYRDKISSPTQKAKTYAAYNMPRPSDNTGSNQQCELDHLISLEIGGADDLSNIWPECSPGYAGWDAPGSRDKDKFE